VYLSALNYKKVSVMIEDIDYLKKHSEADSIAFFADSSLRDQRVFPSPAEFCIEFSQPFKNVFGFDILDAAIPSTMYNVDAYNCHMDFTCISSRSRSVITPEQIAKRISFSQEFSTIFESDAESFIVMIDQGTDFIGTLVANGIYDKYVVCVESQVANDTLQVVRSIPSEKGAYVYLQNNGMTLRTDDVDTIQLLSSGNVFIEQQPDSTFVIYSYGFYNTDVTEYFRLVALRSRIGSINSYRKKIELGNYSISELKTEMNNVYNPLEIFVESTTTDEGKQGILRLMSKSDLLLVNARKKNLCRNIGFDLFPSNADSGKYGTLKIGDNYKVFTSVYDPVETKYTITAPGIVNLMGERFIILRCKEIEDHLYGSFSYSSYIPGIAMFKMGAVNDISNLRFDYVSLVRKPIHPIGKVTKLTFRFETVDGRLYDFKGVNNQMLLMIKFWVPSQKYTFERSILNPNYDGNYLDYMTRKRTIQQHEESDEEQEFDDEENFALYKKKLDEYDDDDDDDDDDTESYD
jgi:hypothetical protein